MPLYKLKRRREKSIIEEAERIASVQWGSPGPLPAQGTWQAATVSAPAAEGSVYQPRIRDETANINYEEARFPAALPLGNTVIGTCLGRNDSSTTIGLRLIMFWQRPDGTLTGAKTLDYPNTLPGHAVYGATASVPLNQAGNWTLRAVLGKL